MGLGKGLKGFGALSLSVMGVTLGAIVGTPSVASAHALFVNPVPRDTTDTKLKMGPCGGDAMNGPLVKKQPVVQYAVGAKIMVDFKETVAHQGCYLFQLSTTGDDKNFTMLKLGDGVTNAQVNDPAGNGGNQKVELQLPAGVMCQNCTLRMIQVMLGANCAANQDPTATPNYYSCVDVRIGDFQDAGAIMDAGPPDFDASSSDEPDTDGPTTEPTDGGGKTSSSSSGNGATGRRLPNNDGGGCNVGIGTTSGVSLFLSAGIAAMAFLRRRKKS